MRSHFPKGDISQEEYSWLRNKILDFINNSGEFPEGTSGVTQEQIATAFSATSGVNLSLVRDMLGEMVAEGLVVTKLRISHDLSDLQIKES